ncbi:MAG: hypothetical protein QM790_02555 [Nibricoccus sp.]
MVNNSGSPFTRYKQFGAVLRSYFYSGWAFLIPYLFFYLLYYATKWPVNSLGGGRSQDAGASIPPISTAWVPPLLHVYWGLHTIHVILAGVALWSWWENRSNYQLSDVVGVAPDRHPLRLDTDLRHLTSGIWPLVIRLIPWIFLALLFYIPGVYLEWPSDPWEHLRRINEWRILDTVGAHSSWIKSAYFIPYSLLSWCTGLRQLFWLDFYYTGICLLLCWQYYRFSRACGLGERASMVFVIIQALLFGNNIFSFYRYYGISSSIYAQLGAIALTRIFLEWAAKGTKLDPAVREIEREPQKPSPITHGPPPLRGTPSALGFPTPISDLRPPTSSFWHLPSLFSLLASGFCLLALTTFNHIQGLGIAALGIAAVIVWRLIEWKRSAWWWLIVATFVANALFLWLYPRSDIIESYRAQGWLNAWYGFNTLDLKSSAGDRMLQIVGFIGLFNISSAVFLLRRNNVIAWLTILPFLAILLPLCAIPFSVQAHRIHGETNVVTFQRLLFSVPPFLAVLSAFLGMHVATHRAAKRATPTPRFRTLDTLLIEGTRGFALLVTAVSILVTVANSGPTYNRFWSQSMIVPHDLQLSDIFAAYSQDGSVKENSQPLVITTAAGNALTASLPFATPRLAYQNHRAFGQPAVKPLLSIVTLLGANCAKPVETVIASSISKSHFSAPVILDRTNWTTVSGLPPEFSVTPHATEENLSRVMQNSPGKPSQVFTSAFFRVNQLRTYKLEVTIRQIATSTTANYLAVAWYDGNGVFLESQLPPPRGAGNPLGWSNGTYSYFGLTAKDAPASWTTYDIAFGLDEPVIIPARACYMKVGVLLNINSTPDATVQISDVRLTESAPRDIQLLLPSATNCYTSSSIAAHLSQHWPAHQMLVERAGIREIKATAGGRTD